MGYEVEGLGFWGFAVLIWYIGCRTLSRGSYSVGILTRV